MNDGGTYLFPDYRGSSVRDTPGRREGVINILSGWTPFSNSSPVEGINEAISTYDDPGRKISLYVLGDEFSGYDMQGAIDTVDRLNKADRTGARRVRIHAVGFPTVLKDIRDEMKYRGSLCRPDARPLPAKRGHVCRAQYHQALVRCVYRFFTHCCYLNVVTSLF